MIIFPENSLIRTISTHKYRYFPKKSPRKQDIFIENRHRFKIFPQKAPQIQDIFIKNHTDTSYFPKRHHRFKIFPKTNKEAYCI